MGAQARKGCKPLMASTEADLLDEPVEPEAGKASVRAIHRI